MKKHAIIPVFIPHEGCPNDCVFCNQKIITAKSEPVTVEDVKNIAETYLSTLENMKVETIDEDDILIGGKQFISLKRFTDVKIGALDEMKLLNNKNKELAEQSEALKVLLKNQLNDIEAPEKYCDRCKNGTYRKPIHQYDGTLVRKANFCDECGRDLRHL